MLSHRQDFEDSASEWVLPKQRVEIIDGRVYPTLGESQALSFGEAIRKQVGTTHVGMLTTWHRRLRRFRKWHPYPSKL